MRQAFGRTSFMLVLVFVLPQLVHADLNECKQAVRDGIKSCNDKFNEINAAANSAGSNMAESMQGQYSGRGTSESLMNAANANSAQWAQVAPHCRAEKQKCAQKCNAVTPQEKRTAEDAKFDCFGKVEEKISLAQQYINQNSSAATGSAYSGNQAGAQGANELGGSNRPCAEGETCGQRHPAAQEATSNLDMIRKLQQTQNCSQVGAGNETICVDANGMKTYVPSGPGDAFKPFR